MWPMIGSTFSSPEQLYSTLGQAASICGYASTPYTGGLGTAVGIGAQLFSAYEGVKAGYAENNAEVSQKHIDNFKEMLSSGDSQLAKAAENLYKEGGKKINTKDLSVSERTIAELIDRSGHYWKRKGWSEDQI
jgi:DNA modification methylase